MNVVLVHDWLTGLRGGEKCLGWACQQFPQGALYTLLHVPHSTSPVIDAMRIRTSVLQMVPGAARFYRHMLPLMPFAIERMRPPANTDLVLSFSHAVAKGIIPPAGVPHVCYCFTPMRYAWELRDDYFPPHPDRTWLRRAAGFPIDWTRDKLLDRLRAWDQATSHRVTHFVAISRTVAERIRTCYGRESHVIHPPANTGYYTPIDAPSDDFYCCVSALSPYKRIDLAIAACNKLRKNLVIIGDGPQRRRLQAQAGPTVRLMGWQSDSVIRDHLRRCRALLFPGLEDFGIVPVEAQACGAPVIAYGRGGATETVVPATSDKPGSGMFFVEQSVSALADAILAAERDTGQFCRAAARASAMRFTTERYAREMADFIASIHPSRRRLAA